MKEMNPRISEAKKLFIQLARELRASKGPALTPGVAHRNVPLKVRGNLFLVGEQSRKYEVAFKKIAGVAPQGVRSLDSLDELVSEHLSAALRAASDIEIKQEGEVLASKLREPPGTFIVKLAVHGFDPNCNGLAFGEISLRSEHVRTPLLLDDVPEHFKGEALFAATKVNAVDRNSAVELAEIQIDRHLAVLNAICSDAPPTKYRLSRTFAAHFDYTFSSVAPENGEERFSAGSATQILPLKRDQFSQIMTKHGGELLSNLLRSESSLALRIISAFETAGTACLERQPHISFLLFAIALESAVLGGRNEDQLTFQLALRTAHLLSAGLQGRRDIYNRVKRLYGFRSRVAHSGSKKVDRRDVIEMKYICLSALYSLLSYDQVCKFEEEKQLEQWFEDQMLDSATLVTRE